MHSIPFLLIYSRIVIALVIVMLAIGRIGDYSTWIAGLMLLGLLTDVFDGIIARQLGISTEKLRIWDSNVDQFFWLAVLGAVFYLNLEFVKQNLLWLIVVLVFEVATYVFSYFKFKRTIATHSILAKIWTVSLLWFLIDLVWNSSSLVAFWVCVGLGIVSRLEILLMILKLNNWTTDIPSIWAVSKINQGLTVKKNRLFNS